MTKITSPFRLALARACLAAAGLPLLAALMTGPGWALKEAPGEMANLKACEKRLCTMILGKVPTGDDLECDVQKTWAKSTLEGGKTKGVSWGFGDARCSVDLTLERSDIIGALTKPKHTIQVPSQQVKCVLEREGELKPLTAKLAPKLVFKNGKADKVWINLEEIEGPADVKSTLWTAAKLEDTLGIFHGPMIKSINKFMYTQCTKRYGPGAKPDPDEKDKTKTDAKAKAVSKTKVAAPAKAPGDSAPKAEIKAETKPEKAPPQAAAPAQAVAAPAKASATTP